MCWPVSRQSRYSLIFFLQQEPEPEPKPRARIRFWFFLGQNDTVPAVPVPQHCCTQCQIRQPSVKKESHGICRPLRVKWPLTRLETGWGALAPGIAPRDSPTLGRVVPDPNGPSNLPIKPFLPLLIRILRIPLFVSYCMSLLP